MVLKAFKTVSALCLNNPQIKSQLFYHGKYFFSKVELQKVVPLKIL